MDAVCKIVQEFNRIVKDLTRYLDRQGHRGEGEDRDGGFGCKELLGQDMRKSLGLKPEG